MQLSSSLRIVFVNEAFAHFLAIPVQDLIGKNIEYSPVVTAFDDLFGGFLAQVKAGLDGTSGAVNSLRKPRDYLLLSDRPDGA